LATKAVHALVKAVFAEMPDVEASVMVESTHMGPHARGASPGVPGPLPQPMGCLQDNGVWHAPSLVQDSAPRESHGSHVAGKAFYVFFPGLCLS
jgi:hypothetical protein